VEWLLVDRDARIDGKFDQDAKEVAVHLHSQADDEDLIDLAAAHTLRHRGQVYAIARNEIPEESSIAAVLRY
jgi:hypothetical protein